MVSDMSTTSSVTVCTMYMDIPIRAHRRMASESEALSQTA